MALAFDRRICRDEVREDAECRLMQETPKAVNVNDSAVRSTPPPTISLARLLSILSIAGFLIGVSVLQILKPLKEEDQRAALLRQEDPIGEGASPELSPSAMKFWIESVDCRQILSVRDEDFPQHLAETLALRQLRCRKEVYSKFCVGCVKEEIEERQDSEQQNFNFNSNNNNSSSSSSSTAAPQWPASHRLKGKKIPFLRKTTGARFSYDVFFDPPTTPEQNRLAAKIQELLSRIWIDFPGATSLDIEWHRDTLSRRENYLAHDTVYGCLADPTIVAMKTPVPSTMRDKNVVVHRILKAAFRAALTSEATMSSIAGVSPVPIHPYRLALLFMINGSLKQEKIWTTWLQDARNWSLEMFEKREGPYEGLPEDAQFTPLYSLHVHFAGPRPSLYTEVQQIWRRWGPSALGDWVNQTDTRLELPTEFQNAMIPEVQTAWGDLNGCESHMLTFALRDPAAYGFIFISDTTVPVKPFSFIYGEFAKNPRTRMFFGNINLPNVQKHHQWIVLNRAHAHLLVANPTKWVCDRWMNHHYPSAWIIRFGAPAAPDEYLPFYALSSLLGLDRVLLEINDGVNRDLYFFNHTAKRANGSRQFRHTWLCWTYSDVIEGENCYEYGKHGTSVSSPVTYSTIYATAFEKFVIRNRAAWFARKFPKTAMVQFQPKNLPKLGTLGASRDYSFSPQALLWHKLLREHNRRSEDFLAEAATADIEEEDLQPWANKKLSLSQWLPAVLDESYFSSLPLHSYAEDSAKDFFG